MVAGELPQGTFSNHPKMRPIEIPKKEALSTRVISPNGLLKELAYGVLQQSLKHSEKRDLDMSAKRRLVYGAHMGIEGIWFRAGASFHVFSNMFDLLVFQAKII